MLSRQNNILCHVILAYNILISRLAHSGLKLLKNIFNDGMDCGAVTRDVCLVWQMNFLERMITVVTRILRLGRWGEEVQLPDAMVAI